MTKNEFILYQAIVIKKQRDWKNDLFASLGKKPKFCRYLCDNHPFFKFPCGFDADMLLSMACFKLKIGTVYTQRCELWKLAEEYYSKMKDKTPPNSKAFRAAINEAIKKRRGEL